MGQSSKAKSQRHFYMPFVQDCCVWPIDKDINLKTIDNTTNPGACLHKYVSHKNHVGIRNGPMLLFCSNTSWVYVLLITRHITNNIAPDDVRHARRVPHMYEIELLPQLLSCLQVVSPAARTSAILHDISSSFNVFAALVC